MRVAHAPDGSARTSYEEVWPAVASRLDKALRSRGVPISVRDDAIQETAARLWERWCDVDASSDVFPLAFTIARNLVTDRAREHAKLDLRPVVECPSKQDPVAIASARIELGRVLRTMMSMRPRYRDLLLAEAGFGIDPVVESGGVVTNMARMRARNRLRAMLERAGAGIALPLKRLRSRLSSWSASARAQLGQSLPACTLEVAFACVIGLIGSGAIGDALEDGTNDGFSDHSPRTILAASSFGSSASFPGRASGWTEGEPSRSARDNVSQVMTPRSALDDLPHSKGRGTGSGWFGTEGYDLEGKGNHAVGDEKLRWRQRHRSRTPRCVRRLDQGEISSDCSGGRPPRGYVEVEYGGRKERVEY